MWKTSDESNDTHSDTESLQSSQVDILNTAMIWDNTEDPIVTPSRKKMIIKKSPYSSGSDSDTQNVLTRYTKSIYNNSPPPKFTPSELSQQMRKYPVQSKNIKQKTVTIYKKNNSKTRYQNLCSICLDDYSRTRGILKCGHKFCFQCIDEWIKTSTNCPCCRDQFKEFVKIQMHPTRRLEVEREIVLVEQKKMEFSQLDYFVCYECNRGDDEDVLLICDMCDYYSCHVYCDNALENVFPTEDWFCKFCKSTIQRSLEERPNTRAANRTQSLMQTQRTYTTRTVTASMRSQTFIDDYSSSESENEGKIVRQRKNKTHAETTRVTRSKAYQVFNLSHRNPRNRLPQVIERISNNTAVNLRNLRRRRYHQ